MFRPTPPIQRPRIQTAIIGAGVMGLSIARALTHHNHHHYQSKHPSPPHEILLLERSNRPSTGITSRNSQVIHAGIYYSRDVSPLKSLFCVRGKRLLYSYCRERHIDYRNCGKLIVATTPYQKEVLLPRLLELGKRNGVDDLRLLSGETIVRDRYSDAYEENVHCLGGIHSPSTGIVDVHGFVTALLADVEESNSDFTLALNCAVEGGEVIGHASDGYQSGGGGGGKSRLRLRVDGMDIDCENVIVCAGLASDKIAQSILMGTTLHELIREEQTQLLQRQQPQNNNHPKSNTIQLPRQYYAKGNYFKLENQKSPFQRLIYPLPDPKGGLGVHATMDLSGSTRFGPDVQWLPPGFDGSQDENFDWDVDAERSKLFYDAIREYWPGLEDGNLVPDYSGVRPKLWHPDLRDFGSKSGNDDDNDDENNDNHEKWRKDFMIAGPEYHGVKGLIVLLGMESPGLTSSLAVGEYVAQMVDRNT
ncbi:hypothetical protein ACHAXS_002363 [Conticribra weissflogii]